MKKIRITESDLHNIVLESVKRILEGGGEHDWSIVGEEPLDKTYYDEPEDNGDEVYMWNRD